MIDIDKRRCARYGVRTGARIRDRNLTEHDGRMLPPQFGRRSNCQKIGLSVVIVIRGDGAGYDGRRYTDDAAGSKTTTLVYLQHQTRRSGKERVEITIAIDVEQRCRPTRIALAEHVAGRIGETVSRRG